jgi:hypothetical protein
VRTHGTPLLDDGGVYYGNFLRHKIKLLSNINVFHQSFLGREACGGGKNHTRACDQIPIADYRPFWLPSKNAPPL